MASTSYKEQRLKDLGVKLPEVKINKSFPNPYKLNKEQKKWIREGQILEARWEYERQIDKLYEEKFPAKSHSIWFALIVGILVTSGTVYSLGIKPMTLILAPTVGFISMGIIKTK